MKTGNRHEFRKVELPDAKADRTDWGINMGKNVTLSDIAAKTGVSIVTVSKALSGQKGVSEATRKRICKAAQEMGRADRHDGNPSRKVSYTIGVVTAARYLTDHLSMYWAVYRDLSVRLAEKKCFGFLEIVPEEEEAQHVLPRMLERQSPDGILVLGSMDPVYVRNLEKQVEIPVVFVDTLSPSGTNDCVISNNYLGGQMMVEQLLNLGHRNIGFVGTLQMTNSIDDRYFGAVKALMERGIVPNTKWRIDDRDPGTGRLYEPEELSVPREGLPSAFFCSSDRSAELFIARLKEMGLRVPEDISIAGFDNYEEENAEHPFLTTYDIDRGEMVRRAVHVLLHRIGNGEYRSGTSLIQGKCVTRGSTRRLGGPIPYAGAGDRKR